MHPLLRSSVGNVVQRMCTEEMKVAMHPLLRSSVGTGSHPLRDSTFC